MVDRRCCIAAEVCGYARLTSEPMADEKRSDQSQLQPAYVVATPYPPDYDYEPGLDLSWYVRVLWKRRWLIVLVTLLCGVLAFLGSQLLPKQYRAVATLFIQPPLFASELRPEPLSVESYQSIVQSPAILEMTRQELVQGGAIDPEAPIGSMETEIHLSRTRNEGFTPIIDLVVKSESPALAKLVANTWADVAIRESAGLATRGRESTLEFIQREYPTARQRLEDVEKELREAEDRYERELHALQNSWGDRIVAFQKELDIEAREQQLEALRWGLTDGIVTARELKLQIESGRKNLEQVKLALQEQPQFLLLSKAISDDALWEKIGRDFDDDIGQALSNLKLESQEVNPVYIGLVERLADAQIRLETLATERAQTLQQIDELQMEVSELNQSILERKLALEKLTRQRDTELSLKNRERDFLVTALERAVESSRTTFQTLAQKREESLLATAEQDQDIKIGTYAVEPRIPVSPRPLLNTVAALAIGLMGSVFLAFVLEFLGNALAGDSTEAQAAERARGLALRRHEVT